MIGYQQLTEAEKQARHEAYMAERAREEQQARNMRAELLQLAKEVAGELGDGWSAKDEHEDYPGLYLTGPDGSRVYMRFQGYREYKRLDISTGDPADVQQARGESWNRSGYGYSTKRHEISVAWGRGAKVTAREITRRLLPGYAEDLAEVRERIAKARGRANMAQTNADKLAKILGVSSCNHRGEPTTSLYWHPRGTGYGRFEVSDDTVSAERFTMTVEQARRVFAILAEGDES